MYKIKKINLKTQNSKFQKPIQSFGFTLIELIVVIAILGILSTIGLTSFRTSQIKSRDTKRKSDLEQVQRALEMYMNDYNTYPAANAGAINGFAWGEEMKVAAKDTIYMKQLPKDSKGDPEYCYLTADAAPYTYYKLYATLENTEDPRATLDVDCGGAEGYNYGVASPNTAP